MKKEKTPVDAAWEMFKITGNVAYYLFFKEISKK